MSLHRWVKPDHSFTGTAHEQVCAVCGCRRYRANRMVFWGMPPLFIWSMRKIACAKKKTLQATK